jgi:hypothetical protein
MGRKLGRVCKSSICEAKGEQNSETEKPKESFCELVIASGDAPIALDSFEEVFYPMTTPVDCCGEWHSHSAVTATKNAGVYSFSGRCLPEGRAIIGFVTNEGRFFWQALCELFYQRDVCSVARYLRKFSHGNYDGSIERNRVLLGFGFKCLLVKRWEFCRVPGAGGRKPPWPGDAGCGVERAQVVADRWVWSESRRVARCAIGLC